VYKIKKTVQPPARGAPVHPASCFVFLLCAAAAADARRGTRHLRICQIKYKWPKGNFDEDIIFPCKISDAAFAFIRRSPLTAAPQTGFNAAEADGQDAETRRETWEQFKLAYNFFISTVVSTI
jgi:hypothetical protein